MRKNYTSFFSFCVLLFTSIMVGEVKANGLENRKTELEQVSVYPNPFNSEFSLKFSTAQTGRVNVRLFDILGNEIYNVSHDLSKPSREINITPDTEKIAGKGIFILRVRIGENTYSYRVFKN
jgi:hypothetical protein